MVLYILECKEYIPADRRRGGETVGLAGLDMPGDLTSRHTLDSPQGPRADENPDSNHVFSARLSEALQQRFCEFSTKCI